MLNYAYFLTNKIITEEFKYLSPIATTDAATW